jgi:putative peptide zinc metalloprotease protein
VRPVDQPRYGLAPEVQFARQQGSGQPLARLGQRRVFQLGFDIGLVLEAVAISPESVSPTDLAAHLPSRGWDEAAIEAALKALVAAGLVRPVSVPAPVAAPPAGGRSRTPGPLALRPDKICRAGRPWAGLARGWLGLVLSLIGLAAQTLAWLTGPGLGPALSLGPLLIVVAALVGVSAVHELAHGVVLTAAGGHPRAIGLTLVHGWPAFYCDIADATRLDRRGQIEVALAGLAWQCQIGLAAVLLVWSGHPVAAPTARLWIGLNLATILFNLLPCFDLDGYLALRAGLGRPDLRRAALAAWRAWLGGRDQARSGDGPGLVLFGALAAIAPTALPLAVLATATAAIWPNRTALAWAIAGGGAMLLGLLGWRQARAQSERPVRPVRTARSSD